jgi:WD40 repeat protein
MSETIASLQTTLDTLQSDVSTLEAELEVIETALDTATITPPVAAQWPTCETFTEIPIDFTTVFEANKNICSDIAFSIDGKRLFVALMNDSHVEFPACIAIKTDTWERDPYFPPITGHANRLFLDPTGRTLCVEVDNQLLSVDLLTHAIEPIDFERTHIESLVFSPDGHHMALHSTMTVDDESHHFVRILSKNTGAILKTFFKKELGEATEVRRLHYAANGSQLYIETRLKAEPYTRQFLVFNTMDWTLATTYADQLPDDSFRTVAFSPDNSEWTFASFSELIRQKREYGQEGPALPLVANDLDYITGLRYSPDSAHLAVTHSTKKGNNGLSVYELATGTYLSNTPSGNPSSDNNARARCVAWSPMKDYLALGDYSGDEAPHLNPIRVYQIT